MSDIGCGMCSNAGGQNSETDEEHEENSFEEGFQLDSAIFYRYRKRGGEALGMESCSFGIWVEPDLELAWSKKSSSFFENNFPIFLLSGISNTSIFKIHDILHWINFLVMRILSNIFCRTFCWSRKHLNIFYIRFIFYYCQLVLCKLRVLALFSPLYYAFDDIVDHECSFQFSPEAEFTSPAYVHVPLATNNQAELPCFPQLRQSLQYVETLIIQ